MEDAIRAIEEEWDGCCSEYPATQIIYDTTEAIERLPIIQPEITHEQAGAYLQSTGWMQEHDGQMMLDGAHRLTAQPEIVRCEECKYHYQRNCPIEGYFSLNGFCSRGKRREVTT